MFLYDLISCNFVEFITFYSFLVASLRLSTYYMSSVNRDNFTSSFAIWMLFISLSCLIAVAVTFSIMLSRSGKSGHLCFTHDPRGETFSLLLLSTMLLWVFHIWLVLC